MSAGHGEVGGEQGPAPAADIATLLLVDDEPENLRVALSMLREHGLEVLVALNGADGLRIAADARPDLVLLDVRMPGLDGIAVCRRLKADAETRDIPVIFLTALTDIDDKARGFGAGGVDYIGKPFDARELLLRVVTHLRLARGQAALPTATATGADTAPGRDIRLLLRARDRLRAELHRPHGLDELARVIGTNRTTLNRLFQTHLGTSVMGYLREQRLQRARALLTNSTWSLEQISTAVGYQNPGALSRALRARFGTTPTELRKRAAGA